MTKRSAMAIAGGLVAALLTGAVAMSLGWTGPETASATSPASPRAPTIERTVTVHRPSEGSAAQAVRTLAPASAPMAGAASDGLEEGSDEAFEDERSEDDGSDDDPRWEDDSDDERHGDGDGSDDD